jgi:hypothetical protein
MTVAKEPPRRLYHVSETQDIVRFVPRKPTREDLALLPPLVWAIDETHLPNF